MTTLFAPGMRTSAPDGDIYYAKGDYSADFTQESIHTQAHLFIHELTHVWQAQNNGGSIILKGISDRNYAYDGTLKGSFYDYGIEQQAEITRGYFELLNGVPHIFQLPTGGHRKIMPTQYNINRYGKFLPYK